MKPILKQGSNSTSLLVIACAVALSGCDSDNSNVTGPFGTDDETVISNTLTAEPAGELIRSSLLNYYAPSATDDGGSGSSSNDALVLPDSVPAAEIGSADGADSSAESDSGRVFSDTNVQEAGVDEADRVKIDGDVLYALETPDINYSEYQLSQPLDLAADSIPDYLYQPQVETLSAYKLAGGSSSVVSRLPLEELSGRSVSGMYLYRSSSDTDLVLLSGEFFAPWSSWGNASAFGGLETRVSWVDASDPGALSIERTMDIEGYLISSRRVDNRLILVTRFHPQIDGVNPYAYTEEELEANRMLITNADASDLLPSVNIIENGETTQSSLTSDNLCYVSTADGNSSTGSTGSSASGVANSTSPAYSSPSIISIVTVDLNTTSTSISSSCFIGDSETLYVSPQSVYLATTEFSYGIINEPEEIIDVDGNIAIITDDELGDRSASSVITYVHKFDFSGAGAPVFRGSGSVKGHLGWNPDRKPFRMSEKDNNLRIVTFDESLNQSPVTLSILQESGGRLSAISTLPNESRPAPIGKPNESLYASRFIGDKAYLVTFLVTDPLYVLDLSDPRDPQIAGELEIPGYSDYLHPVNDSLLIGVGKDAVEANIGDGRGAWFQGVKLALYDVADPANPFVADERTYGKRYTDSPALYQHHSFTYLAGDGARNARLALPLSLHNENAGPSPSGYVEWTSNSLLTLEVDEGSNRFVDVPGWELENRGQGFQYSPVGLENDRAIIGADNDLYLIHNGTLNYGPWGSGEPSLSIRR